MFPDPAPLRDGLQRYTDAFVDADRMNIACKLGLSECTDADVESTQALHALLLEGEVDMTLFFRNLADVDPNAPTIAPIAGAFYDDAKRDALAPRFEAWLARHAERVRSDTLQPGHRRARMNAANPRYVLRNYLAQQAIDRAEHGDYSEVQTLLEVMRRPYEEQPGREAYAARRPDWARERAGCSMLSCSS